MSNIDIEMRPVRAGDAPRLEAIREAAFAPVFASFRAILGDDIYDFAQAREDAAQGDLLASLLTPESIWEVYAAEVAGEVVGFVSVRLDDDTSVAEIGLNGARGSGHRDRDVRVRDRSDARSGDEGGDGGDGRRSEPRARAARVSQGRIHGRDTERVAVSHALSDR